MKNLVFIFTFSLLLSGSLWNMAGAQAAPSVRSAEIIYQTGTYTPPFYRGKALPSGENTITAVAYPDLSGTSLDPARLHYKWIKDGVVMSSYTGVGKRLAVFDTSIAADETLIEVEIADPSGSYRAKKAFYLSDKPAKVLVYEDNAALGVLYNQVVPKTFTLAGSEAAFVGAPYFFSAANSTDPAVRYQWNVGGEDSGSLSRLTVRSEGGSGLSPISLQATHANRYTQFGSYAFTISFGNDRTQ